MNVINLLPAARPRIDDRAESRVATGVCNAQFLGEPRRQAQHSTKQRRVGFGTARERLNMFTRNHEHMNGSSRIDIVKSDEFIVFVDFLARNFSRSDLAENAVLLAHVFLREIPVSMRVEDWVSDPGAWLQ